MAVPIYCMSTSDVVALEIAGTAVKLGVASNELSLVSRQSAKDAKSGRISGTAWTMRAGVLATWPGIAVVQVRDLGKVLAAGRIRHAFDGAATGELMQLAPALTWLGIPRHESRYYAGMVYMGWVFVMAQVQNLDEAQRVERGWEQCSAREISYRINA